MSKAQYVSIGGVWRKIVKEYVSMTGVWRKVKKTYVSINGVWRDCTPPSIGGGGKIVAGAPKIIIPQAGAWNIFLMHIQPSYADPHYDIDNRRPEDNMYNAIISDEQLNPGPENPGPIYIYLSRRDVGLPAGEYADIDDDFMLMYFYNLTPAAGSSAWNAGDYVEARSLLGK